LNVIFDLEREHYNYYYQIAANSLSTVLAIADESALRLPIKMAPCAREGAKKTAMTFGAGAVFIVVTCGLFIV
jgi:hypothetical protein